MLNTRVPQGWRIFLLLLFAKYCYSDLSDYNVQYSGVTSTNETNSYRFPVGQGDVVAVFFSTSNATEIYPMLIAMENDISVISAKVPSRIGNFIYRRITRTFCPYPILPANLAADSSITVLLSSLLPVQFDLKASRVPDINLSLNKSISTKASTAAPIIYQYSFEYNVYKVEIKVDSKERSPCMQVSAHRNVCPVFDIDSNPVEDGNFITMTTSGTITLENEDGKANIYFLVFSVLANDDACEGTTTKEEVGDSEALIRIKQFTITATVIDDQALFWPLLAPFLSIIVIIIILILLYSAYEWLRYREFVKRLHILDYAEARQAEAAKEGRRERSRDLEIQMETGRRRDRRWGSRNDSVSDASAVTTAEAVQDARLTVAQTSTRNHKARDAELNFYIWNAWSFFFSYGLPAGQLLLRWATYDHSDLEECYYNFRCAHPAIGLYSFNNVFSNIGYFGAGAALLILAAVRHRCHLMRSKKWKGRLEQRSESDRLRGTEDEKYPPWGVPHHNALTNAVASSFIAEGFLSACYHICPSAHNYQFDMTFMYNITMLTMLNIYQHRHQDNTPAASRSLFFVSVIILFTCLGIYFQKYAWIWILFYVIYFFVMLFFASEFYMRDRWSLDEFSRDGLRRFGSKIRRTLRKDKIRAVFLVLVVIVNIGLIAYPKGQNFPLFELAIFIVNMGIYLFYYIFMKVAKEWRIMRKWYIAFAIPSLLLSLASFGVAMSYFTNGVSDWSATPAHSREQNHECIVLGFYDNHDIWHFFSALGLLFGLIFIMVIDDCVGTVPRDQLVVF